MARRKLRLFVWDKAFTDYSDGLAVVLAHDSDEARRLLVERIGYTHPDLVREPKVIETNSDPVAFYVHGGG